MRGQTIHTMHADDMELSVGTRTDVCTRAQYLDTRALAGAVVRAERAVSSAYTTGETRAAKYALAVLRSEQRRRSDLRASA